MYALALSRDFEASHFLVGGDWGPENDLHSHPYRVRVTLYGDQLDQHGYLVDLVQVEEKLESLVERFRGSTLNDLPEFAGLNPSLEHFARIFCEKFAQGLEAGNVRAVEVRLWESEDAWASYRLELG